MDNFFKQKRMINEARKLNNERYQQNSKKRLMKNVECKFKTTMIGALARFEERFGYLWGHNKEENELTENELQFLQIWQEIRTEILNNGNTQLRAALDEIAEYTLTWNRHKMELIVRKNTGD